MNKKNIVLIGMPGCGKSIIGRKLATFLDREFYDTDAVIEIEQCRRITDIFEKDGEAVFRNLETETIRKLSCLNSAIIATGGGAVLADQNVCYMKKNGIIVFIDRQVEKIADDIDIKSRPLLASGKQALHLLYERRMPVYARVADFSVKNDTDIDDVVTKIVREAQILEDTCT